MNQFLFQTEKITDNRAGITQIISNIEVCENISASLVTTLGPYGLDKLFYGKRLVLTNDGATIMKNMNFQHPVARMLSSISQAQDNEVGDGTTSVVVLTSEILSCLKPLISQKYSLDRIRTALDLLKVKCTEYLDHLIIDFSPEILIKLAETSLNSKCVRNSKQLFANLIVKGLMYEDNLQISKVPGGSLNDSFLAPGIVFEKTFTYAGYEQQPKKIENPLICCVNIELEWKGERENSELRIKSVDEFQKVVDAEWSIIKEKLDDIVDSGANIVLSSLPIGDYATQYFASKNIFSAGRVKCLNQFVKCFKGKIANNTKYLTLSKCEVFEERQIGNFRFNCFDSSSAKSHTLVLRGPGNEALDEIERAIHDAICVTITAIKNKKVTTGGGSIEMELSKYCRNLTTEAVGEDVFTFKAISKAFEKIPSQLAENFGLDPVLMIQKLRRGHLNNPYFGVSPNGIEDMKDFGVFEPIEIKKNIIKAAFNAAQAILMIDSTIMSKK